MRTIFFDVVQTKMIRACKLGSDGLFRKTADQAIAILALKPKSNDFLNGLMFPKPFIYLKGIYKYTSCARYGPGHSRNSRKWQRWSPTSLETYLLVGKTNTKHSNKHTIRTWRGFCGGPVVKNLSSNAGDTGSIPGQGTTNKFPHALEQLSSHMATTDPLHITPRKKPGCHGGDHTRRN